MARLLTLLGFHRNAAVKVIMRSCDSEPIWLRRLRERRRSRGRAARVVRWIASPGLAKRLVKPAADIERAARERAVSELAAPSNIVPFQQR